MLQALGSSKELIIHLIIRLKRKILLCKYRIVPITNLFKPKGTICFFINLYSAGLSVSIWPLVSSVKLHFGLKLWNEALSWYYSWFESSGDSSAKVWKLPHIKILVKKYFWSKKIVLDIVFKINFSPKYWAQNEK